MTIAVGDKIPSVKMMQWGADGPEAVTTILPISAPLDIICSRV